MVSEPRKFPESTPKELIHWLSEPWMDADKPITISFVDRKDGEYREFRVKGCTSRAGGQTP